MDCSSIPGLRNARTGIDGDPETACTDDLISKEQRDCVLPARDPVGDAWDHGQAAGS